MKFAHRIHRYIDTHPQYRPVLEPIRGAVSKIVHHARYQDRAMLARILGAVDSGTLVVRVDGLPGAYELNIRSHILQNILLSGEFEATICAAIKKHADPARDVLDVGANVGLFSVLAASLLQPERRVLAIEPTPGALQLLRGNLARNGVDHAVEVFEGVASNESGQAELSLIAGNEEYSSIGGIVHPSVDPAIPRQKLTVRAVTIDQLVDERGLQPGLVKIDTEGAEFLVLSGARHTLATYRPIIVSELADDLLRDFSNTAEQVIELLRSLDYEVRDIDSGEQIRRFPYRGNVLAIPSR